MTMAKVSCHIKVFSDHKQRHCGSFMDHVFDKWIKNLVDLMKKDRICDEVFKLCSNHHIEAIDIKEVVEEILSDKPEEIQANNYVNELYNLIS